MAQISDLLDRIDHGARVAIEPRARLALVDAARVVERRLEALLVTLVAEADAAGASLKARGTPTTSWLALDAATSGRSAAGLIFAGVQINAHDDVKDAALAGHLDVKQARAVSDALSQLPASIDTDARAKVTTTLIERAERVRADQVPRLADQVLAEHAPAPVIEDAVEAQARKLGDQAQRAKRQRALTFFPPIQGSVRFHGSLPVLDAAPFMKLIDAYVEQDRREGRDRARDRLDPRAQSRTPEQRRADALLALIAARQAPPTCANNRYEPAGSAHSGHEPVGRSVTDDQLARSAESRRQPTWAPRVAGDRPRTVVLMNEADLRNRAEQAGVLANGQPISAGDLRRLCCDAELTPVVLGTESEILDVGRTQRLVSPVIRQALSLRDGGCSFPGCRAPDEQCEAHHETPWHAGGTTSLATTALLCPHHHALIEPPRFQATQQPPDRWQLRMNRGRPEFIPPARIDPGRTPIPGQSRTAMPP